MPNWKRFLLETIICGLVGVALTALLWYGPTLLH